MCVRPASDIGAMFAERANHCNAHERAAGPAIMAWCVSPRPVCARSATRLTLRVGGRPIASRPGDSVAAALVDAGVRICRITGSGEGRGVFCGMGVCQECVMTIDGAPPGRA